MRSPRSRSWIALPTLAIAAALTAGTAVAAEPVNTPDPDAEVTFTKDVLPILQENCQVCHQPGGIGPMTLMSYEEVRPWARVIKLQVESRNMPPYHYDTDVGIQKLKNDKRLSDEQIATISAWVEAGSPLGNPADAPPPVAWPDPAEWRLSAQYGQPDVVVKSTPYTVPAAGQDRWWQPNVPSGITEDRCIMAIETKPSLTGRSVTHHANTTFRSAGDTPGGGGRLSEYALGKLGEIVPKDACRIAPANSSVSFDIHYYPNGNAAPDDQVSVGIWFYPESEKPEEKYRQTLTLYYLQSGTGDFEIPPHGTLMTQGFHRFNTPVRIDSFQPHGHLRLVAKRLEILDPATGRRELVSMVSNWNPGWHLSHVYEDDVAPLVPVGAFLVITAWYDNTANNPFNPDPDQWVGTGDRTADEMSHAWIAVTHLDQAGYDKIRAERGLNNPAPARGRATGDNN